MALKDCELAKQKPAELTDEIMRRVIYIICGLCLTASLSLVC